MAEANKPVPKATTTVFGKVILCTAPANPANPIVVGCNDPRIPTAGAPTGYENISGAGTDQTGATQSIAKKVFITGGVANSGIKVTDAILGYEQHLINKTAFTIKIYPKSGHYFLYGITVMAANIPISLPSKASLAIFCNVVTQMSTI